MQIYGVTERLANEMRQQQKAAGRIDSFCAVTERPADDTRLQPGLLDEDYCIGQS